MIWPFNHFNLDAKSLLAFKEGIDLAGNTGGMILNALSRVFGWKTKPTPDSKAGSAVTGPKGPDVIDENRVQEGELYALLSWIVLLDEGKAVNYQIVGDQSELFPLIAKALPTGATKALMQTIAVEVVTMTSKEVTGYSYPSDPKDKPGNPPKRVPIHSEWQERVNLKGPQIVRALTWFAKSQTGATNEEKARKVAAHLESFHIFDNLRDGTFEWSQKATEKLSELWSGLVLGYGIQSVDVHEKFAAWVLRRYTVRERNGNGYCSAYDAIMQSQAALVWKERIAAEPDVSEQRKLHEGYRGWLQKTVIKFRKDNPDPNFYQGAAVKRNSTPKQKPVQHKWRIIGIYIVGGLIIAASLVKMATDARKNDLPNRVESQIQQPK